MKKQPKTAQSHQRTRTEQDIEALTGILADEQRELCYLHGLHYLRTLLPHDPTSREYLEGERSFWTWWRMQWHGRNLQFIALYFEFAAGLLWRMGFKSVEADPHPARLWARMPSGVTAQDMRRYMQGCAYGGMPQYYHHLLPPGVVRAFHRQPQHL